MIINRDYYLEKLINRKWNGRIKVITGLRRVGKSFLLFELFRSHLLASGVSEKDIIAIALDRIENEKLRDPMELYKFLKSQIEGKSSRHYVLIDEVQYAISSQELRDRDNPPRLYGVLNSLLAQKNVDVYITGSNSKLLSKDIMTEFRGRGDNIEVFPLSFIEYLSASAKGKEDSFNDYLLYGGLPYTLTLESHEEKAAYLSSLFTEIYFKDIEERYSIEKEYVLSALVDSVYSTIGSFSNVKRLSDSINSSLHLKSNSHVSINTIASYLSYSEDAFLLSNAKRYDVRGKKYFESQRKYYATDLGLRNAKLNFRQIEEPHLMENAIYIYLKQKGFLVDVGVIEKSHVNENGKSERVKYEIDFVVNKGMYQYYIQSAYSLENDEKRRRELYPFSITGNSFKKIVVTSHELRPHYDENGIFHVGIVDFLLGDYLSD